MRHADTHAETFGGGRLQRDRNAAIPWVIRFLSHLDIGAGDIVERDTAAYKEVYIDTVRRLCVHPGRHREQRARYIAHAAGHAVPRYARRTCVERVGVIK